jgi:guanylate kinase
MANACKSPTCRCEHIDCDYGWIYGTFVTVEEKNTRKDGKIQIQTEYEGVKFCPQCDPQRAHIQETSSSAEELQRRLSERTTIKRAEIYEKQEASKTRIL